MVEILQFLFYIPSLVTKNTAFCFLFISLQAASGPVGNSNWRELEAGGSWVISSLLETNIVFNISALVTLNISWVQNHLFLWWKEVCRIPPPTAPFRI